MKTKKLLIYSLVTALFLQSSAAVFAENMDFEEEFSLSSVSYEDLDSDFSFSVENEIDAKNEFAEEDDFTADSILPAEEKLFDENMASTEDDFFPEDLLSAEDDFSIEDDFLSEELLDEDEIPEITLYAINYTSNRDTRYLIPENYPQSFPLPYEVYWINGFSNFYMNEDNELCIEPWIQYQYMYNDPDTNVTTYHYSFDTYDLSLQTSSGRKTVKVHLVDYGMIYCQSIMQQYLDDNILPTMTDYEKLRVITQFPTYYKYDAFYSTAVDMILQGGGDCWASTDAIVTLCDLAGIESRYRDGRDTGLSGHTNALAITSDGRYYILEAGSNETILPRHYSLRETDEYWRTENADQNSVCLISYQGITSGHHIVPSILDGLPVTKLGKSAYRYFNEITSIELPSTLTEIDDYALYGIGCNRITIPEGVTRIGDHALLKLVSYYHLASSNSKFKPITQLEIEGRAEYACIPYVELPSTLQTLGADLSDSIVVYHGTESDWNKIVHTEGYKAPSSQKLFFNGIEDGWHQIDDTWYYYLSGNPCTGWQKISGKWYYFDESSRMQTGLMKIDGQYYYLNESGAMYTGWKEYQNTWYYFTPSGSAQIGWMNRNSTWYYFTKEGKMVTGTATINNELYSFDQDGKMQTGWQLTDGVMRYFSTSGKMVIKAGWQKINEQWYYFDSDGSYHDGWLSLNGKTYYIGASGIMFTEDHYIDGSAYYFNPSGSMVTSDWVYYNLRYQYFNEEGKRQHVEGWHKINGDWYYFDSHSYPYQSCWLIKNDKYYFFNNQGKMVIGWHKMGERWYYFSSSGARCTGWQLINNNWYYFSSEGVMYQNRSARIDGKNYYFYDSGKMATGWMQSGNDWFYYSPSGERVTGWLKINNNWYLFGRTTGTMQHDTWERDQGYTYYLTSSGKIAIGWQLINDQWYYFDAKGHRVTGTQVINGKTYTFDISGVLLN